MATFVTQLESQIARRRRARIEQRGFAILLTGALTILAVLINGYHPFAEDGGLYAAGVKRLLDPRLYNQQTSFVLEPTRFSIFAPTIAGLVRLSHLSLPVVLLLVHLASVWATLFAAWMLAARCWQGREERAGAVALLACWLGLPVAGTSLALMDPYVTARSFSTPCMVLALVGALDMTDWASAAGQRRRGFLVWTIGLVVAAAMHPLMTAYAAGATLLLMCERSPRRAVRVWGTAASCAAALAIAGFLWEIAAPESTAYIRAALTRTYWFPAEWRWYELAGLAAPLAILAAEAWLAHARSSLTSKDFEEFAASENKQSLGHMAVAVGVAAWVAAMLFARAGAATHLVARLQPLRAFQIVYLVMILALGAKLGRYLLRHSAWRWAAALMLLGGVMLGVARASFADSAHLELPGSAPHNAWVKAFVWIRDNTPRDALFALDSDYIHAPGEGAQCFRAIAERSALPDFSKDGGEASIAPDLTDAWVEGEAAQRGLSSPEETDAARVAALRPLGVSWVVLQATAATQLDCPYRNGAVQVCRVR